MKITRRCISLLISLLVVLSMTVAGVSSALASDIAISYTFESSVPGYAEGTITLSSESGGTYELYWGDDKGTLEGYRSIGSVAVSGGEGTLTMPAHTVIPTDATMLLAYRTDTPPAQMSVSSADVAMTIPAEKRLNYSSEDALYTFGAISDPQLANDSYGSGSYPYDEEHLTAALETMAQRGVDFIVSSGDTVNDQNGNQTYAAEYKRYQRILADSPYCNPIYEANGNHDVGTVWNKTGGYYNIDDPFVMGTGLDSTAETINAGKPYFEITEPATGDHFIFMALEGGFYTDRGTQFSTAQLDWLEGLLKKYSDDGNNIFIIEHANIAGWGAGDKLTAPYYYDLGLNKNSADVKRFISLMETYKECVVISGHTHLELSAQYNYCDMNGTSAVSIHNSAVGGVRRLVNGSVDRTAVKGMSEGYIVEVYEDCVIFSGTNLYYNEIMPQCSYIVCFDTDSLEHFTEETEATTETDVTEATTTEAGTTETTVPTTLPTETSSADSSTQATETTATEETTDPADEYIYGDADLSGNVNVKDATLIQKHSASLVTLEGKALLQADVSGEGNLNVIDATYIQKFVASMIALFPVERTADIAQVEVLAPELESAKQILDDYYMYSSYDQYMALKRAYLADDINHAQVLPALEEELVTLVEEIGGKVGGANSEITVYFTNNYNWSTVKAYVWGNGGTLSEWPGSAMTYAKTNSQNQKIYSVTFDFDMYQNIIFTDGSSQTVDITLTGESGVGYYISGESSGKYTCSTYTYS